MTHEQVPKERINRSGIFRGSKHTESTPGVRKKEKLYLSHFNNCVLFLCLSLKKKKIFFVFLRGPLYDLPK